MDGKRSLKGFAFTIILTAALLTATGAFTTVSAQPPLPPMLVYGYVFIHTVEGLNVTAPENLTISAKYNMEVVSNTTTEPEGKYAITIGTAEMYPPEGAKIDLWVQEVNVTRITLAYWTTLKLNLTVIDTVPPTAPTNLAHITPVNDTTPAFAWAPSTDNLRVEGYYAQITGFPIYWIGNVTTWESPDELPDGTHTFSVWAKDLAGNNGTGASIQFTIQKVPPPTADFYAQPTSGYEPLTVHFYDNSTNFETKTSWLWLFGDETNSTEQNPVHTYLHDGAYTVTLTVTGTNLTGLPDTATITKTNYITVLDTGPTADFHATPTSGAKPLTVAFFDDSTSYDGIVSRLWNFGDGFTSTEQNPVHIYTKAGVYSVTLTVTEADGDTDTKSKVGYIVVSEVAIGQVAVTIDVGSIHFRGEMAEFYFATTYNGRLVNITDATLTLYKPPQGTATETINYTSLATGVYLATYNIPVNAEPGTYTLVIEVSYITAEVEAYGASLKSFLLSSTLTGWNAKLISINGTVAEIKTDTGIIRMNLTEIGAQITSISGTVATINTAVGTITAKLDAINATLAGLITDAKGELLAKIDTAAGTITAKLDAIKPVVTSIKDDVATIKTEVGTIKGKVINIDGNVATVMTDVGIIKADASSIKTNVGAVPTIAIAVWIAVVLSLIAAIAACYSVITIRRKIAG